MLDEFLITSFSLELSLARIAQRLQIKFTFLQQINIPVTIVN